MSVNPMESVAPSQAAPESTPAAAPEVPLAKKYGGDWNKANEGYFNAVKTLNEVQSMAKQLLDRNQQLEQAVQQLAGGRSQPAPSDDPLAEIQSELGLPVEPFRKGINGAVQAAVAELFAPIIAQTQAEEALSMEIENFPQLKADARKFMSTNEEVATLFNALRKTDPAQAWKYAIRESVLAKARGPQRPPASASLPGGSPGGGRMPDAQPVTSEKVQSEAWDYYHQYGDARPASAERYKGTSIDRHVQNTLRHMGIIPPDDSGGQPQGW